ncbi:MAG: RidA family protein [Methylobacteriaceae bacterium]|nr:RidA family protein [Methylobacteriaceae bacterium]
MRAIVERAGYAPAVRVGDLVYVVGQVGRSDDLEVIADPATQFARAWENVRIVLEAAGCSFADMIDVTTYHVDMARHMDVFRAVKNRLVPREGYAWTRIGVSELAHPGLLVEIKCVAAAP